MRRLASILFIVLLFGCKTQNVSHHPPVTRPTVINSEDSSDWEERLADWLEKQPQDVREAFIRDFMFSSEEIDSLLFLKPDSIKIEIINPEQ